MERLVEQDGDGIVGMVGYWDYPPIGHVRR